MRTLTIHTDAYLKELDEATSGFIRRVKRLEQGFIKLYYETFDTEGFYSFLEWAAFQENAALRGMPKLTELTRKLISPDIGARNIESLDEYIKKNRGLHVEGYVRFRMAEYNNYLNCLLYAIMKRTKV
ncbi:MAG: putative sporulation protein YtxC [Clostridiales bacterium]|nr:putative sporulation protein YtxC [Clostridiales bacterium]